MAELRSQIFDLLEDEGRRVTENRIGANPINFAVEQLGTRRVSELLGVTQRSVQRYAKAEREGRGQYTRLPRGTRALALGTVSVRELRRAGARALGRRQVVVREGSSFVLCYQGEPQGNPRQMRQDYVIDNQAWLAEFDAGARAEERGDRYAAEGHYLAMEDAFVEAFFEQYGVGGDVDICQDGSDLDLEAIA